MAQLANLYIKKDTLQTILKTLEAKGTDGLEFTLSINDNANDYGQNISAFVSQTKEQREQGMKKFYVGNGKNFWSNKGEFKPSREAQSNGQPQQAPIGNGEDELPY